MRRPPHERFVDVAPYHCGGIVRFNDMLAIVKFEPTTPHPRIAAGMKASDHDDALWINSI